MNFKRRCYKVNKLPLSCIHVTIFTKMLLPNIVHFMKLSNCQSSPNCNLTRGLYFTIVSTILHRRRGGLRNLTPSPPQENINPCIIKLWVLQLGLILIFQFFLALTINMNMNFLSHLLCCFLLSVNFIILREKRCYFFSFKLNIMFTFAKKRQNFAKKNLFINFVIIKHLLNLRRDIFNYDKIKLLMLSFQRREFQKFIFCAIN